MIDFDKVTKDAKAANIKFTELDRSLLELGDQYAQRLATSTSAQRKDLGIDPKVEPVLNIAWEVEFFMNDRLDNPVPKEEAKKIIERVTKKLDYIHKCGAVFHSQIRDLGHKYEVSNKPMPFDRSVEGYYEFRKAIAEECAKKGFTVRKRSTHMHYTLMDKDGDTLLTTEKDLKNSVIGKNLAHLLQKATPLFALDAQLVGTLGSVTDTLDVSDINADMKQAKRFAVRKIPNQGRYSHYELATKQRFFDETAVQRDPKYFYDPKYDYEGGDESRDPKYSYDSPPTSHSYRGEYHYELRKTLQGSDKETEHGFDGFTSGVTAIAAAISESLNGEKPEITPKHVLNEGVPFEEQVAAMQNDQTAQRVFGKDLIGKLGERLLHCYDVNERKHNEEVARGH